MFYYYYYYFLFFLFILSIESCPLKKVDSRSGCYCGIEIDGTNYIHCQPYSITEIPEFTRSYIHDKLNLSSNFIRNLTHQSFEKLKVKKIYLEQNLIEFIDKHTFDNNLLNYLEELHIERLNHGTIEFLCYGKWTKLRVLKLISFDLTQYQHCLEKLHRLEILIIQHSQVNNLFSSLSKLTSLTDLSLNYNHIESLKFDDILSLSVKSLNLSFNQIRTIPNDFIFHFPYLHTLDLSHNFIDYLPSIRSNQFIHVNLSFNPLCTFEKPSINQNHILHQITQLHCDCRLAYYLEENLSNLSKLIDLSHIFDDQTQCSTPEKYRGRFLKDLTYEQLVSTCSDELPMNCREVNYFHQIPKYTKKIISTTTSTTTTTTTLPSTTTTMKVSTDLSSFRLTSFSTSYDNNNLIVSWNFDSNISSTDLSFIQFQIILEQDSSLNTQIIRRSGLISPSLKQYTIHHIPLKKNYYICLLLTRSSYGTDKYCRETRTIKSTTTVANIILSKQAFVNMLFANRSIVFGFLFGTILTTGLLLTLAFVCHLRSKRQQRQRTTSTLYHRPNSQQHYLYVDHNEDDDRTYSNSLFSCSSSTKYNHLRKNSQRRRTCFPSLPTDQSWYRRPTGLKPYPTVPLPPPCCFHHHHHHRHPPDTTISSTSTTRRLNTLSSQYSNGLDKEPMTSTSIMSSTSSEEQTTNSPAKHVYEELSDESTILRRNHINDILL